VPCDGASRCWPRRPQLAAPPAASSGPGKYKRARKRSRSADTSPSPRRRRRPERDRPGHHRRSVRRKKQAQLQKLVDKQIGKMKRPHQGHPTTIPEGYFWFRIASSTPTSSAFTTTRRARSTRRSSTRRPRKNRRCSATAGLREARAGVAAQAVRVTSPPQVKRVRAHGRGALKLAFLLTSVKKEDQAREFSCASSGLPELEVHPRRVPVVRRVLFSQKGPRKGGQPRCGEKVDLSRATQRTLSIRPC